MYNQVTNMPQGAQRSTETLRYLPPFSSPPKERELDFPPVFGGD